MEDIIAGKLLSLAAVAANSAAADLAAGGESEEEDTCSWSREGSRDSGLYDEGSEEDDEEGDGVGGKRKRMSVDDRKARNRERNRLHARKTRQRKKQHVQELQLKIWGLRQERQRLLQLSTEHRTAGVLLALSCSPKQCVQRAGTGSSSISRSANSPRLPPTLKLPKTAVTAAASASGTRDWNQEVALHEDALRKITQEFERMDGSQQVGEEDELASAGAAAGNVGRGRAQSSSSSTSSTGGGGAGGGKGGPRGAKGTLADRTALRRERNRMHAKRTRNRKKLFVEACSVMIDKMKVENAQLEYEIQASGIHLPQDNWTEEVRETIPEEPLPEYLAALWDFAEGKSHIPKTPASGAFTATTATATVVTPPATPVVVSDAIRQSRRASSSSSSSSSSFSYATSMSPSCESSFPSYYSTNTRPPVVSTTAISKAPPWPPSSPSTSSMSVSPSSNRPAAVLAAAIDAVDAVAASTPGQALEDATALCAFMEAAQTRSMKRCRVTPPSQQHQHGAKQQQTQPRGWSDHDGSTTSESRGGSEFSEEDSALEGKAADRSSASSSSESSAVLSPAFWTSRQVLERYVMPRQQLPQG